MRIRYLIVILIIITFEKNLIKYEETDKIGILKFNNPEKLNKFEIELLIELDNIITSINIKNINILIITGEGNESFTIGERPEEFNKMSTLEKEEYKFMISKIFNKLENYPLPILAIVKGFALREGFELVVCCDFIICSENAIFGFYEQDNQDSYEFENPQRLLKHISKGFAKNIFLQKII